MEFPGIKELQALLKQGYDHYFEQSDGTHKSAEAQIEVAAHFPNLFESDPYVGSGPTYWCISVYSYVLGPHRNHDFEGETYDEVYQQAYTAVKSWVDAELERVYED